MKNLFSLRRAFSGALLVLLFSLTACSEKPREDETVAKGKAASGEETAVVKPSSEEKSGGSGEGAPANRPEVRDTPENKALFAMGYSLGMQMGLQIGYTDEELEAIFSGLRSASQKEDPPADLQKNLGEAHAIVREKRQAFEKIQGELAAQAALPNIEKGKAFFKELDKDASIRKTESGLYYKIIKEGTGDYPVSTDKVKVNYRGALIDGTEFDSSFKRNKPLEFQLNRVIKGWTEGLQLIREGGKIKLYIPSELGYGNRPRPGGKIKPGDALVFDVDLLEIVPKITPATHPPKLPKGIKIPANLPKNIPPPPSGPPPKLPPNLRPPKTPPPPPPETKPADS